MPVEVILIDQSLRNPIGHHLEYTIATRDAFKAMGATVSTYGNASMNPAFARGVDVTPHFHQTWTERDTKSSRLALRWLCLRFFGLKAAIKWPAKSFGADLNRLLDQKKPGADDIVFIHTLNFSQLLQAAQVAESRKGPSFHFVLRQDPGEGQHRFLKAPFLRLTLRVLGRLPRLYFYSDTRELCRIYSQISGMNFQRLPIMSDLEAFATGRNVSQELTITYLGDGRLEKGFHLLPELIGEILNATSKTLIEIQAHLTSDSQREPLLQKSLETLLDLQKDFPQRLVLHQKPLSRQEYADLLFTSDAVLVPYDLKAYRLRSSGVLAQAVSAGKIVFLPAEIGLIAETPEPLRRVYQDARDLARLCGELEKVMPPSEASRQAAESFRDAHSVRVFIQAIQLSMGN